jgi:hypothetical protein
MKPTTVFSESWTDEQIAEIETHLLQGIFGCRSTEAVEAALTYARYLSSCGISPENYPVFLRMLEIENHWVIDALVGDRDPFLLLSSVQPNKYIVERIFAMLTRWHRGGIYPVNLHVILGVLQSVYTSSKDGYRIYPLTIANVNALGKHLDKEKGQDEPLNRVILEILDRLSELNEPGNAQMEEVAIHASSVRQAFFDDRKMMSDVIPPVLLVEVDNRVEVTPSRAHPVSGQRRAASSARRARSARKTARKRTRGASASEGARSKSS